MKLFHSLLTTGLLALGAPAAYAQTSVSFGPRLGLNISTFSNDYPVPAGLETETKAIGGFQIGGTANIAFGSNFALQPSLLFSQKGAELIATATDNSNPPYTTSGKITAKPKLNFLELPLNLVYTFGGEEGFQVFAGPYLAVGVGGDGSGKVEIDSNDPNFPLGIAGSYPFNLEVEYGDQQNDNASANNPNNSPLSGNTPTATITVKRFDAGLNFGIGYRKGPFQGQLGYGLGLANFVPKDTDGNDTGSTGYHRVFQLTGAYFFGGK